MVNDPSGVDRVQLTGWCGGGGSRNVSQAEQEMARRWRLCKTEVRRVTFPKTSDVGA